MREAEGRAPQLTDDSIQLVDAEAEAFRQSRFVPEPDRGVEGEAGDEDALDHYVVHVPDAVVGDSELLGL
ncbi:MAG: hypothetical protein E6G01_13775 [Actinobacteria bacterium]|nr:MAG: hypothetical protein E6G01_13775 [Actinomycetota bacterium]